MKKTVAILLACLAATLSGCGGGEGDGGDEVVIHTDKPAPKPSVCLTTYPQPPECGPMPVKPQ